MKASESGLPSPIPVDHGLGNPFRLVAVTVQRARQLKNGARPRLDGGTHTPLRVALLEAMAGLVSWEVIEAPPAVQPPAAP